MFVNATLPYWIARRNDHKLKVLARQAPASAMSAIPEGSSRALRPKKVRHDLLPECAKMLQSLIFGYEPLSAADAQVGLVGHDDEKVCALCPP